MTTPFLPYQRDPIAGSLTTPNGWYEFFRSLRDFIEASGLDPGIIDQILARLDELEANQIGAFTIQGLVSVDVFGTPEGGVVQVQLKNDVQVPGNTYYYGTGPIGVKGWFTVASAFAEGVNIDFATAGTGVTTISMPAAGDGSIARKPIQYNADAADTLGASAGLTYDPATAIFQNDGRGIFEYTVSPAAPGVVISRLGSAVNAVVEFRNTGGSMFAGAINNATYGIGYSVNLTTTTDRAYMVSTTTHQWYTGASGAATIRMQLDSTGQLSVNGSTGSIVMTRDGTAEGLFRVQNQTVGSGADYRGLDSGGTRVTSVSGATEFVRMTPTFCTFNETGLDIDFRIEGDTLTHQFFCDATSTTENIAFVTTAQPNWQTMNRGLYLGNASAEPTGNPTGGDFIWSNAGSLRVRTPGGNIATVVSNTPMLVEVYSKSDLPAPVAGVITLVNNVSYQINTQVDLTGDRIVCGTNNALFGNTADACGLTSTGLAGGVNMITSTSSLDMRNIRLSAPTGSLFNLNDGATNSLNWTGLQIIDTPTIGTIQNYANIVINESIISNSANLTITGTIASFVSETCLWDGRTGQTTIIVPAAAVFTRRFRMLYTAVSVQPGETGINFSTLATIPDESYILDNVSFTGGGTYLAGLDYTSNKSSFFRCFGITNTNAICQYSMTGNATATVIAATGTFVKVAGTTVASALNQKFNTATTNRGVYTGAFPADFNVSVTASMRSGNNQNIRMRIAKNGTTISDSNSSFITTGAGDASAVPAQTLTNLTPTDFLEVFVTNDTAVNNITVSDLNVIIRRLG